MSINKSAYSQDAKDRKDLSLEERKVALNDLNSSIEQRILRKEFKSKTDYLNYFCKDNGISYKSYLVWEKSVVNNEEPKLSARIRRRIENSLSSSFTNIWCRPYYDIATFKNLFSFNKLIFEAAWGDDPSEEIFVALKDVTQTMIEIKKYFDEPPEIETMERLDREIKKTTIIKDLISKTEKYNITIHAAKVSRLMLKGLNNEILSNKSITIDSNIGVIVASSIKAIRSDVKPEDILIEVNYDKL